MGGQRSITAGEAIRYVLDPRHEREFHVMGANVTSDCPEDHDLDGDGDIICDHLDGVTADEIEVYADASDDPLDIDVEGFASYGPFFLDWDGDDPGAPQDDHDAARAVDFLELRASESKYVNRFWVRHSAKVLRDLLVDDPYDRYGTPEHEALLMAEERGEY